MLERRETLCSFEREYAGLEPNDCTAPSEMAVFLYLNAIGGICDE
jgi:hypothetical protein